MGAHNNEDEEDSEPGLALLNLQQEIEEVSCSPGFQEKSDRTSDLYAELAHVFERLQVCELARHFHVLAGSSVPYHADELHKYKGHILSWGENDNGCLGHSSHAGTSH